MKTTDQQNFVPKGWGYEKWIVNNDRYCGKLLRFVKGRRCSYHFHKLKDEVMYIASGRIQMVTGTEEHANSSVTLEQGDSFHIPVGLVHQMIALEDSDVYEFSTQHFDEDSYRINKGD